MVQHHIADLWLIPSSAYAAIVPPTSADYYALRVPHARLALKTFWGYQSGIVPAEIILAVLSPHFTPCLRGTFPHPVQ